MTLADAIKVQFYREAPIVLIVGLSIWVAFACLGDRSRLRIRDWLGKIAERRAMWIALFTLAPLLIRLAALPWLPIPSPKLHDEYSQLLSADTAAAGRLANPTHPQWRHFETIYVLQQPSYSSIYPPGVGAALAVGQRLFGHPWFGAQIASALTCGAVCWLLFSLVPPIWAIAGSLLYASRLGNFSYWADSYIGGSIPALGGVLLIGGLVRFVETRLARYSFIMALGWAFVWFTRPYESIVLGSGAIIVLLFGLRKTFTHHILGRVILPAVPVILATAAITGLHNWRVTGSPLTFPYKLSQKMYGVPSGFLWQDPLPGPTDIRYAGQRDVYLFQRERQTQSASGESLFTYYFSAALYWVQFYLGFLLLPAAVIGFKAVAGNPWRTRFILWLAAAGVSSALYGFFFPHYHAPYAAIVLWLVIEGLRRLSTRHAVIAVSLLVSACISGLMTRGFIEHINREEVEIPLQRESGRHLVLVHYDEHHSFHNEWVYNRADIDSARIVWARQIDPVSDAELVQYFKDRTVWRVEVDQTPPHLTREIPRGAFSASTR